MLATRAADASVPIVYVNLVGGQDELVFDGGSMVFDEGGHLVARASQFAEDLLVVDSTCSRRSAGARSTRAGDVAAPGLPEVKVSEAQIHERADEPRVEPPARAGARGVRGARGRHPRLRDARTASPTCSSGSRAASTRRSSPRSRPTRSVPSTSWACSCRRATRATGSVTDAEALAANLGIRTLTVPIEPAHAAFLDMLAEPFAGTEAGPRRGEPPGAHPRHDPDDALEQVRLARAHDREQERDGHRLLDALRRHGRRVRGDQGRPEDARVRAVPRPQRARRSESSSPKR